jgi:hypothetical protein
MMARHSVDGILLNGDIIDFHHESKFEHDPRKRSTRQELDATREFLDVLNKAFDCPKYYKIGNHEERLEKYLMRKAPELFGNSEFMLDVILRFGEKKINLVDGKTMIMNTTNGTKAVTRASLARKILIGCFLNAAAVVEELRNAEGDIIIICAGWKTRLSLEDMLCAGLIIDRLCEGQLPDDATDGAKLAHVLYQKYSADIESAVSLSNHAIRLKDIAHPNDISYCSQLDRISIVPYMKDGIIVP